MTKSHQSTSDSTVQSRTTGELSIYSSLVEILLRGRGIHTATEAKTFLNPNYEEGTHDPFLLKDMDKAVARITRAVADKEHVTIYGDYDADGIPGAVVLYDFFRKIGHEAVTVYIPHRHNEGYGLNTDAISSFVADNTKLLITVDCGIVNVEQVDHAIASGMDVIITDHHLPQEVLPRAYAIINPKQPGDMYPYKMLCGAAVAWKVVQALVHSKSFEIVPGWEKWLLDMVGIATLSDMVPLTGENRILARYGLTVLQKSKRPGIKTLLSILKIAQAHVTEDDIAFMLTPRINAASRMGVAHDAWKLLASDDSEVALELCQHLNKINDERKGHVAAMIKDIKKHLDAEDGLPPVIVAGNPEWRPSLLGLAANSLAEEHDRPVFLWGRGGDGTLKGSCRSARGINLVELMGRVPAETFIEFGGHAASGGFSIDITKVDLLKEELGRAYTAIADDTVMTTSAPALGIPLPIGDVNWQTYSVLEPFAPFGLENPKPLFRLENVTVAASKLFGKEKNHSEIQLISPGKKPVSAISFFSTIAGDISSGMSVTLLVHIEKSMFKNYPELRLRIVSVESTTA